MRAMNWNDNISKGECKGETTLLGFVFCEYTVPLWVHFSSTRCIPPQPMPILYSWEGFVPPLEMDEMAVESCRTLFLIVIMITPYNQNHKPRMSSIGSAKLKSQHLIRDGCLFHSSLSASRHVLTGTIVPIISGVSCHFIATANAGWLQPHHPLLYPPLLVLAFMVSYLQHLLLYSPFFITRKVWFCQHHCPSRCHFAGNCMVRWWQNIGFTFSWGMECRFDKQQEVKRSCLKSLRKFFVRLVGCFLTWPQFLCTFY